MNVLGYVKEHPYLIGGAVFAIGALYLFSRGSGGQSSTDAGLAAAFYGAQAADSTNASNQVIATTNANAAVDLAQIQADAYTHVQDTWAQTSEYTTDSNNAAAVAVAPYALTSQYIQSLAQVASLPGTTTQHSSSGFFGIGGGSSTTYTPNPAATAAGNTLNNFNPDTFLNGFLPGH